MGRRDFRGRDSDSNAMIGRLDGAKRGWTLLGLAVAWSLAASALAQPAPDITALVDAGKIAPALDLLLRSPDPSMNEAGSSRYSGTAASVARRLRALDAADRYAALKTWTMPDRQRRGIRRFSAFVSEEAPPAVFGRTLSPAPASNVRSPFSPRSTDIVSTAMLLIESAREVGKLRALADELGTLADRGVDGAAWLRLMSDLALGNADLARPKVEQWLADVTWRPGTPASQVRAVTWDDYLLARACLADPQLAELGKRFAGELDRGANRAQRSQFVVPLRCDLAAAEIHSSGSSLRVRSGSGLPLWGISSQRLPAQHVAGSSAGWWVAYRGHVGAVAGTRIQFLTFDYPLTGSFDVSVDALAGRNADSHLSYGAVVFEPYETAGRFWRIGQESVIGGPKAPFVEREGFNRVKLEVRPDVVRCFINGQFYGEDANPNPGNPWLALFCRHPRRSVWRNLRITGEPTIPREVRLDVEGRLDGWIPQFYVEPMPMGLPFHKQQAGERGGRFSSNYHWYSADGIIHGPRRAGGTAGPIESLLYHYRPLRDGEYLRYRFHYKPGEEMTHPVLDRLAFLIEPEGVRLHWLTAGPRDGAGWSGLSADNAVDVPAYRRGPKKLPFRPDAWNLMELQLEDGTVSLALNKTVIYECPLEAANDRQFGLFHYKDQTAVQVREVFLKGNWPERLTDEMRANLFGPTDSEESEADERVKYALMGGEALFSWMAGDVVRRTRRLPPEQRYAELLRWVLPGEGRPQLRLAGDFIAANRRDPPANRDELAPMSIGRDVLVAPALDLVNLAARLDKLDALALAIDGLTDATDEDRRAQLGMLALIDLARGDERQAEARMLELKPILERMAPNVPEWQRWPELLIASVASSRPTLERVAAELANFIVYDQIEQGHIGFRAKWRRHAYLLAPGR